MIFNKEYDDSLWLMLKGNKKVRNMAIDFFRCFPQDLLMQIRESLKKYNEIADKNELIYNWDLYKNDLTGSFSNNSGMLYRYAVSALGVLEIGESIINGDESFNVRYISLFPFDKRKYESLDVFTMLLLGNVADKFSYIGDIFYVTSSSITETYLLRNIFNTNLINTSGYLTDSKEKYCLVNLGNIPEDYSLTDMKVLDDCKKLVRKKDVSRKL